MASLPHRQALQLAEAALLAHALLVHALYGLWRHSDKAQFKPSLLHPPISVT